MGNWKALILASCLLLAGCGAKTPPAEEVPPETY